MCTNCTLNIDATRADAFAERMIGTMNQASLALMCSIGHRTRLFDTMVEMGPSTSQEIAEQAGLSERYVREWLGAMTTGGIVEHQDEAGTYWLPAEHAAYLTREAGADNIAQLTQWFGILGHVESEVVEAFRHGNGVPYSAYTRFHEVMAAESALTVVAGLEDQILPLVPGLIQRLEDGIDVLDVGCGRGKAMLHLARRFPHSRFTGYDFSDEAIEHAQMEAGDMGLENITFKVQDAATFTETDAYDLICTFDAVHDQAKPDALLANIHRALRPGGVYFMQDIQGTSSHAGDKDHPIAPFIYTISTMHCMSVSLAYGGAGLGAAWGKQTALQMLAAAGFDDVRIEELPHDFTNYYYIARSNS